MPARWFFVLLMVAILGLGVRAVARAEADPPAGEHAADKKSADPEKHGDGEEEHLDPFSRALDLTVWSIVVFLLLMLVLWLMAWKPMLKALQDREHNIKTALEEAQRARAEGAQLRAEFEQEKARAHDAVRQMIEEARRDAERLKEEIKEQGRTEVQAERDRARRDIDTARDQALAQITERAADLAAVISAKFLKRQVNPDDHRRLVDEALVDLESAGKKRASAIESVV
jgi:F-type H+-transporting ATPase subunit b